MHLFFPAWLRHGRPSAPVSIFSVDIQPFGSRLASAGQDCAVKIWSLTFLAQRATRSSTEPAIDTAALSDKPPPGALLATLSSHSSAVNCVRWSPDGSLLASAADDTVVLLYELDTHASAAFGQRENWRVRKPLRAHSGDVTDLAWSPDGERLASASVDNLIYIWHVRSHRTIVCLRGHTGLVKGVAWDPVGRYIASQSDDKTVRIWRTSDWKTEKVISKPFDSAVFRENSMAFYLRISWSPCGTQLLCTNACKRAAVHTAPMFSRDSAFDKHISFMGHREPVISTRFSPRLYRPHPAQIAAASEKQNDDNQQLQTNTDQASTKTVPKSSTHPSGNIPPHTQSTSPNATVEQTPTYTCLALGSKDCGATIWKASAVTPFFEIAHLFDSDVIDLTWGTDGYTLVACSTDRSAMYFRFEAQELGEVVSESEMRSILTETWRAFGAGVGTNASAKPIAETPTQLRMELTSANITPRPQSIANHVTRTDSPSPKPPLPIASDKLPAPVQAAAEAIKKKPTPPADPNFIASQTETRVQGGKRRITPRPVSADGTAPASASKPPLPTSSSSVFSDAPISTPSAPLPPPLKRPRTNAHEASLRGEPRVPSTGHQQNGMYPFANGEIAASKHIVPPGAKSISHAAHLYAPSVMGLSMMLLPEKSDGPGRCRIISRTVPPVMLESREHHGNGGGFMVTCSSGGKGHWRDYFPKSSPVTALAGIADKFVAVGTADASLYFYSASSGRRLTPPIVLDSAPYILEAIAVPHETEGTDQKEVQQEPVEEWFVVLISRSALCSVFDVKKKQLVCARSAVSLIARPFEKEGQGSTTGRAAFYREISQSKVTIHGEPILILSDGDVFVYSRDFSSWLRVADDKAPNSDYTRIGSSPGGAGILRSLQSAKGLDNRPIPSLSGMGDLRRAAVESLAHLESLMESAIVLGSARDYRYYLTNYASRVAAAVSDDVENCIMRLREICDMLLNSKQPGTDLQVLGMSGRKLLRQSILPVVSMNRQMQRFVAEYTECLAEVEKRAEIHTTKT